MFHSDHSVLFSRKLGGCWNSPVPCGFLSHVSLVPEKISMCFSKDTSRMGKPREGATTLGPSFLCTHTHFYPDAAASCRPGDPWYLGTFLGSIWPVRHGSSLILDSQTLLDFESSPSLKRGIGYGPVLFLRESLASKLINSPFWLSAFTLSDGLLTELGKIALFFICSPQTCICMEQTCISESFITLVLIVESQDFGI